MSFDRLLLVFIVFILTVALVISEFARFGQSKNTAALETRLDQVAFDANAALKAVITPETLSKAEPSVYMVVNNNDHYGTAFVLDREKGILVTAAHVAVGLDLQDTEQTYSVINRHSKKLLRIRAREIHDGFEVFRRIIEDYQPIDPDSTIASPKSKRIIDIADDAALLFVDPIDPDTGENILGPALPLASEATLKALAPGDPIAVIGYPIDTITDDIEEDSAAARVERGVISTMLSPIDVIEQSGDVITQNLIVHRMATAPGNSGGPILNRTGEIIGISSHGHDSIHSNGDSLAQRADVIHDMITPFREQDLLERIYIPDWQKRLATWPRAEDILPYIFYRRYAKIDGDAAPQDMNVSELKVIEKPPFDAGVFSPKFGSAQKNFTLHADDLETKEGPEEEEKPKNNQRTSVEQKPVFLIDSIGEYAAYSLNFDRDKNHAIFVFDYTMAWTSRGYCPLTIYSRRQGDDVMRSTRQLRMPSIMIKATDDTAVSNQFDIIVRRDACDARSKEFLFGIVSWEPETPAESTQISQLPVGGQRILASFGRESARVENFLNCNIEPFRDEAMCEKAIKVRNITLPKENLDN